MNKKSPLSRMSAKVKPSFKMNTPRLIKAHKIKKYNSGFAIKSYFKQTLYDL